MVAITHPPQLDRNVLSHSAVMRFTSNAAFANNITFQNILDTFLVATSATAGVQLFQAVRINRVRIWALPALGQVTTVTLEFSGLTTGAVGDQQVHSDTSMGQQPAYIDAVPNSRSQARVYQLSSTNRALTLVVPTGSVIDMHVTFRGQFGAAPSSVAQALVGATAGQTYLRGLDALPAASTVLPTQLSAAAI